MGGICCTQAEPEFNPDGSPKELQTIDQKKSDPIELRRAAKDGYLAVLDEILPRMPKAQICQGAPKTDGPEEEAGFTALHFSASINHLRAVKKLVLYEAAIDARSADQRTPLNVAVNLGKRKVTNFLLDKGANINSQDARGNFPLLSALSSGRLQMAKELMSHSVAGQGLNFDLVDKDGNSVVLVAARYMWIDLLKSMLAKVAKPEKLLSIRNKNGETVLGWVIKYAGANKIPAAEAAQLVHLLLDKGAMPTVPAFPEKVPPVCLAAAADSIPIFQKLVKAGGPQFEAQGAHDALGRGPLHYAAARGAQAMVVQLLGQGMQPYQQDKAGNTPLHLAVSRGQLEVVKLLIDKCDDPRKAALAVNKAGMTPLHLSLLAGPSKAAQDTSLHLAEIVGDQIMLIGKDLEQEVQPPFPDGPATPMQHLRRVFGRIRLSVPDLVAMSRAHTLGCMRSERYGGDTALLLACQGHQHRVVELLISKGADVNAANALGEVPLSRVIAAATPTTVNEDVSILDQLMDKDVDINAGKGDGYLLLKICQTKLIRFSKKVMEMLHSKGTVLDWDILDSSGCTPLMLAAAGNNDFMCKYLIDKVNVDVNARAARTGTTALMKAAEYGSVAAMKVLLNRGANPRLKDRANQSTLSFTMKRDIPESLTCASLLLAMGHPPEDCTDLAGEGLVHRAVRYGTAKFIGLWAMYGGDLNLKANTAETADAVPGDEEVATPVVDVIDSKPPDEIKGDEEDEEHEEDEGKRKLAVRTVATTSRARLAKPVAEGIELRSRSSKDLYQPDQAYESDFDDYVNDSDDVYSDGASDEGDEAVCSDGAPVAESTEVAEPYISFARPVRGRHLRCWLRRGPCWWDRWYNKPLPNEEFSLERGQGVEDEVFGSITILPGQRTIEEELEDVEDDCDVDEQDEFVHFDDALLYVQEHDAQCGRLRRKSSMKGSTGFMKSAGPVAESLQVEDAIKKVVKTAKKAKSAVEDVAVSKIPETISNTISNKLIKKKNKEVAITDPYYSKDTLYKGTPKYMRHPEDPAMPGFVDTSKCTKQVQMKAAAEVYSRIKKYSRVKEPKILGADLRARNIRWYLASLSPEEYPLKPGQWKGAIKKAVAATKKAQNRKPMEAGKKVAVRKKTAWFGLPDMPDHPEWNGSTPLLAAIRLNRPECMNAILKYSHRSLNEVDGFGYTPIAYAMMLLLKHKHNDNINYLVDRLLTFKPLVNDSLQTKARKPVNIVADRVTFMSPLTLGVLLDNRSRLAFMVLHCHGDLNRTRTFLPDVCAYNRNITETYTRRCESIVTALHLAILSRRYNLIKWVLDLGANANLCGEPKDPQTAKDKLIKDRVIEKAAWEAEKRVKAKGIEQGAGANAVKKVKILMKMVSRVEIPFISKPDPWLSPLHLAARMGQAQACTLLIDRKANVDGGPVKPYARRTPVQEALNYARSNYIGANIDADRHNWAMTLTTTEDMPKMSEEAHDDRIVRMIVSLAKTSITMMDPSSMALKAAALTVKYVIKIVLEMRKCPIKHADPSISAAHVLLMHRCKLDFSETQTTVMLRDIMDNDLWLWLLGAEPDKAWVAEAMKKVEESKTESYANIKKAKRLKVYNKLKAKFMKQVDSIYYKQGIQTLQDMHIQLNATDNQGAERKAAARQSADASAGQKLEAMRDELDMKRLKLHEATLLHQESQVLKQCALAVKATQNTLASGFTLIEEDMHERAEGVVKSAADRLFKFPETTTLSREVPTPPTLATAAQDLMQQFETLKSATKKARFEASKLSKIVENEEQTLQEDIIEELEGLGTDLEEEMEDMAQTVEELEDQLKELDEMMDMLMDALEAIGFEDVESLFK